MFSWKTKGTLICIKTCPDKEQNNSTLMLTEMVGLGGTFTFLLGYLCSLTLLQRTCHLVVKNQRNPSFLYKDRCYSIVLATPVFFIKIKCYSIVWPPHHACSPVVTRLAALGALSHRPGAMTLALDLGLPY